MTACAFSPDGKFLVSYACSENRLSFWQTSTGKRCSPFLSVCGTFYVLHLNGTGNCRHVRVGPVANEERQVVQYRPHCGRGPTEPDATRSAHLDQQSYRHPDAGRRFRNAIQRLNGQSPDLFSSVHSNATIISPICWMSLPCTGWGTFLIFFTGCGTMPPCTR